MSRWEPVLASKQRAFLRTVGFSMLVGLLLASFYLLTTDMRPDAIATFLGKWMLADSPLMTARDKAKAARELAEAARAVEGYGVYFSYSVLVFFGGFVAAFAVISDMMKKQEEKVAMGEYVSGNRAVTYDEAIQEIEAKLKDPLAAHDFRLTPQDIRFKAYKESKELRIPRYAGAGHSLYLGASGGGKSQLMFLKLSQIRDKGSKAIILDPGGRYYARFGQRGDRIYSVYDKRATYYDFWSEKGFDYFAIAAALIDSKESKGNEFFTESPQSLFAGLLRISEAEGMSALRKHIYDPDIEFIQKSLKEKTEVSAQFLKDSRLAANVMASYATKLYWLKYLNHWPEEAGRTERQGISEWARNDSDRSWVFLIANDRDWDASKHFFRMLVTLVGKAVYDRGSYPGRVDIHEIQDEIESIGYNAEFTKKLNIGRKDGYIMHGGLQAITQFESIYGESDANTIINGYQNKYLFRSEDPRMAKRMAEISGYGRWRVRDENVSNEGKASVSMKIEERTAFRAEDFFALRPGECIAKISGINPFKFAVMNHDKFPVINEQDMSEIPPI
jgi:hypothetical protein